MHGKYMWPARIGSVVIICLVVAVVNLDDPQAIGKISDKYHLYTTPPGYAFAIWGLIYPLLIIIAVHNLIVNKWSLKAHILMGISNLLNMTWSLVFAIGTPASNAVCFIILALTVLYTFAAWREIGNIPDKEFTWAVYAVRNSLAFYLGWLIAATNLNWGILQRYTWDVPPHNQMVSFWILAPLCAVGATAFNYSNYGKRGLMSCLCLWISVAWAFVGAAITSHACVEGTRELC